MKKEEQKQHLIDIMKSDEELGLYDEIQPDFYKTKEIIMKQSKLDIITDVFCVILMALIFLLSGYAIGEIVL